MNERPGPHLKGRFFQVRLDYVREYYGYEALAELMAALPERERAQLESLDKDNWYPFRSLNALDRLIAELLAPNDPGLFERLGAMSARHRADLLGLARAARQRPRASSRAWPRSTRSSTTSAA